MTKVDDAKITKMAEYIIKTRADLRACARIFGVSTSTIRDKFRNRLPALNLQLAEKVMAILGMIVDPQEIGRFIIENHAILEQCKDKFKISVEKAGEILEQLTSIDKDLFQQAKDVLKEHIEFQQMMRSESRQRYRSMRRSLRASSSEMPKLEDPEENIAEIEHGFNPESVEYIEANIVQLSPNKCLILGYYILKKECTVRECAVRFKMPPSTVHRDVTVVLKKINRELAEEVNKILEKNKKEGNKRGGKYTRFKKAD